MLGLVEEVDQVLAVEAVLKDRRRHCDEECDGREDVK